PASPAKFPRIWFDGFAGLGLGPGSTDYVAVFFAAVFLVAFLALIAPTRYRDALVYGAVLLSPAVMLGVQRGNADLLVFGLLALGLLALRRWSAGGTGQALFLLGAILKLFPTLSLPSLFRPSCRR